MNESRMLWIWFWISQTLLFLNFCPPTINFLIHCHSFQFPPHAHRHMIWNRWDRTWNVLFLSSTERSPVHKLIFKKNNAVKSTPFCCEKHKSGAIEYEFFDFDFPRMTSLFRLFFCSAFEIFFAALMRPPQWLTHATIIEYDYWKYDYWKQGEDHHHIIALLSHTDLNDFCFWLFFLLCVRLSFLPLTVEYFFCFYAQGWPHPTQITEIMKFDIVIIAVNITTTLLFCSKYLHAQPSPPRHRFWKAEFWLKQYWILNLCVWINAPVIAKLQSEVLIRILSSTENNSCVDDCDTK